MEATYTVEQGIKNPRDETVNWQAYEIFETLAAAKRELRKAEYKGLWRIIEARVVWEKPR